jgi:DNA-binding XRE family transcriptional regulator
MDSAATLHGAFETIGETPQAVAPPSPCQVIIRQFDMPPPPTLIGGVPASDFARSLEQRFGIEREFKRARKKLAGRLHRGRPLRRLRLRAGLSQTELAELAKTTQTYIARLEKGSSDPGTDMLVRLANALSVRPTTVFRAVLAQRDRAD